MATIGSVRNARQAGTIEAIAGHLSKRMLDHYSHIRIAAKRKALDDLERQRDERRHQPQAERQPETLQ